MSDSKAQIVSVRLLQPVAELLDEAPMTSYRDEIRGPDNWDSMPFYLTDFASGEDLGPTTSGGPIVLRYASERCGIELPAGRQFMASMSGPVVSHTEMVFPMEPMTWAETEEMVRHLVAMFDAAGWQRTGRPALEQITPDDFTKNAGPKWARIGNWRECGNGPAEAYVTVRHYNSMTGSSFIPPAALSAPLPEDAPDRFIMYVSFSPSSRELSRRLSELVMARRAVEGVDPALDDIPASIWLDDPDWRPEGWDGGF